MEELAKEYVSNPSLIWGLSFAVVALSVGIIWLIRFILFKMITVLQSVASSNIELSNSLSTLADNIKDSTNATRSLITEQALLNNQLQITNRPKS